jgi:nucleoside-diphosphate-sugar epimerase
LLKTQIESESWLKSEFVEGRLAAERLLQDSDKQGVIDLRIARLYSFIGRHLSEKTHYAVPSFVSMAKMNRVIRLSGNPLTTRSYMSAQEMAHWIITAVMLDTKPSILAIGSSIPVTMIELAEFVADNFSADVRIENPNAVGDRYVADNSLTKKILGVNETISWRQSLLEFIQLSRLSGVERDGNE